MRHDLEEQQKERERELEEQQKERERELERNAYAADEFIVAEPPTKSVEIQTDLSVKDLDEVLIENRKIIILRWNFLKAPQKKSAFTLDFQILRF